MKNQHHIWNEVKEEILAEARAGRGVLKEVRLF